MQQNHIAAVNIRYNFLLNVFHRRRVPVIARHIPHDGFKSKLPRQTKCPRPPPAPRRTKKVRVLAHGLADGLAALLDFLANAPGRKKNQLRMGEGMIADHVSPARNFPRDIRPLLHEAPDQKKSGPDVVFAQHIQQPQRVRIIRSIVKTEGNGSDLRQRLEAAVQELGLVALSVDKLPEVKMHELAVPRIAPSVLRLASGEVLVAGGADANGVAVLTLEWFSPDASHTKRTEDLVAGSARAYVALQSGGALAVIAPPAGADATFHNTWVIDPDGVLEAATSIEGALTQPALFGGAGDAPVLWTGDRWLRWQPWLGTFGALGARDAAPAHVGVVSASPDRGLALWLDSSNTSEPRFTALRFDVRGEYSPLGGPLLVSDAGDLSPDHLVTSGAVTFDSALDGGALTLEPGASAFVTDRTYADVRVEPLDLRKDVKITIQRGVFMDKEAKVMKVMNNKVQVVIESIGYSLIAVIDKSNAAVTGK